MKPILALLVLGFTLVSGQSQSVCSSTCFNPTRDPPCRQVTLESRGVDASKSPYYAIFSSLPDVANADSRCSSFFPIGNGLMLIVNLFVQPNGSYIITQNMRADIDGSPGAYRFEAKTATDCPTCVYNDYPLTGLNDTCQGTTVLYRCPIYGSCVNQYGDTLTVLAISSALETFPVSSSCQSSIESVVQQQGLGPLPLYYFPNKLGHRCVTRINGLTAINAQYIAPESSVEINGNNIC